MVTGHIAVEDGKGIQHSFGPSVASVAIWIAIEEVSAVVYDARPVSDIKAWIPLRVLYVWGAYLPFFCSMYSIMYVNT